MLLPFNKEQMKEKLMTSIHKLSANDFVIIKARILRGDYQHDIAADYGLNQGRISEIKKKLIFIDTPPQKEMLNETSF